MADKTLNIRLKNKTDTLNNWQTQNPTLKAGELAIYENSYTYRMSRGGAELTDTSPSIKVAASNKTFSNAQRVDIRAYREAVTAAIEQDESVIDEFKLQQFKNIVEAAESHNSIYRGKDLSNVYTLAQLHEKVSAGDFSDLFLGDYWNTSAGVSYMIYGFNPMYNQGNSEVITQPHIGLIARSISSNAHSINYQVYKNPVTLSGGYSASNIDSVINSAPFFTGSGLIQFYNYLLDVEIYVSSANDSSGATANSWVTRTFWLPSDIEICGCPRAGAPTSEMAWGYQKLPVFNYISPNRFARTAFWTRTLASGDNAIRINSNGIRGVASRDTALWARPCMIFG